MTANQLNTDFGMAGKLEVVEGKGGFPVIEISTDKAKAKISVYSAQVLSFQPAGEPDDLMFVSEKAYYETGKATKGGVPICWPWFGPDPEGKGRASHGFVRNRMWNLLSTAETSSGDVQVRLGLTDTEETLTIWPYKFELTLTVVVGSELTMKLTTQNKGNKAFSITQAFHTYFSTGDISKVEVLGLENAGYVDKVDGGLEKTQTGAIYIREEVDRIYTDVKPEQVIDDGARGRRIRISTSSSHTAIVWNPWSKISANMADLEDNDYLRFVCVETANAADEVIEVAPGSQYELQAVYAVERG